jgi:hypothetical protein
MMAEDCPCPSGFRNHNSSFRSLDRKGNKTVPGKVATTNTEDGHKQDT